VLEILQLDHGRPQGLAAPREDRELRLPDPSSRRPWRRKLHHHADDCGTKLGIKMRAIVDAGTVVASLASRILGRTACEESARSRTNKVVVKRGTVMEESMWTPIHRPPFQEVKNPLGADLRLVNASAASATAAIWPAAPGQPRRSGRVIAAQSIGEPRPRS